MLPLIEAICKEFGIERLELFGSGATGEFDPKRSDLDFLVTYPQHYEFGPWLKRHFELKERLSDVFGRRVDLIEAGAPRNPFVAQAIEQTRQLLCAA